MRCRLALAHRRSGGAGAAGTAHARRCRTSPTARSNGPSPRRSSERTPGEAAARLRGGRARQAWQPRAQLFLGHRSALAVRSGDSAAPRRARSRARRRCGSAQRLVELLQKRDADGYRLPDRPAACGPRPRSTPIALPVDAAISYYESSALPWERAAFIRARAAAGDAQLGRYFLDAIHPFVWRRSLDFGAIGEMQAITRRIRDHYAQGQRLGPGFDLKRGRGGIREVEFYAQIHQLIHGGREPALRAPATLDALAALAEAGHIPRRCRARPGRGLSSVPHDRASPADGRGPQTHSICPPTCRRIDNVARLHGLTSGGASCSRLLDPPLATCRHALRCARPARRRRGCP